MLLLKYAWHLTEIPWTEDHLQMAAVQGLSRLFKEHQGLFAYAAGMEGLAASSKGTAARAKAMGLTAGEPDLRIYWKPGRMGAIELKLAQGTLTASQKARHPVLVALGMPVVVIRAVTPQEAADKVEATVRAWVGLPPNAANGV